MEMNAIYRLEGAGIEAYDIFTRSGRYAGIVIQKKDGKHILYWNSNCTRGSARRFATRDEALEFMHKRRVSKGWSVH